LKIDRGVKVTFLFCADTSARSAFKAARAATCKAARATFELTCHAAAERHGNCLTGDQQLDSFDTVVGFF
jgi:hypothetical protein